MVKSLLTLFSVLISVSVIAQNSRGVLDLSGIPKPRWHYIPEYTFDKPSDPSAWEQLKPGLHAAFGSTDELYLRCEVPSTGDEQKILEVSGWKGERLNAQVVIWSADTLRQVKLEAGDLISSAGKKISRKNIEMDLVRYVVSNYPYGAGAMNCESGGDSAWLMPDRFETLDRFDLPGRSARPVWLSVNIPGDAEPGEYTGSVVVSSTKGAVTLKFKVIVQKLRLPVPHDWSFRLDLWQNPWVVASYYNVVPWSAEHEMLLKKHLKLYADAGGKYVTTYAVFSPWSDNSYSIEGTMIEWIKSRDGKWRFDYSVFDRYVELAAEAGVDKAITIYTPVPWGYRFRYLDEGTGNYVFGEWPPTSDKFRSVWNIFLDSLRAHLEVKGWLGRTYLGINENPLDITMAAINVIRENSKEWKITYAGNWSNEISGLLDDYSSVIPSEPTRDEIKGRSLKGFTSSFYVCCTPARPNNFVFSPPVEGRYLGWHATALGYDGFLRWAYDAWPADPMRDARHVFWPAGDCFLVYPGGNSCIRFEKLREGISDYEKIRILRQLASVSGDKDVKKKMAELEAHLVVIAADREFSQADIADEVMRGKKLVDELSDLLRGI